MRAMLLALGLGVAACGGADKAAEADDGPAAGEVQMSESELAQLEAAIADTAVADVVADDPGGRLADAGAGPAMADPLATAMPEAPVPEAAGSEAPVSAAAGPEAPVPGAPAAARPDAAPARK